MSVIPKLTCLLLILLLGLEAVPAQAKKRAAKPKRELTVLTGASPDTAHQRGLCETSVTAAVLVETGQQYHADTSVKHFNGSVLAYITPWNAAGYESAVRFRAKLTHVSPVWYQLRADKEGALVLVGGHEYNATWLQALRAPVFPLPSPPSQQQQDNSCHADATEAAGSKTAGLSGVAASCSSDAGRGTDSKPAVPIEQQQQQQQLQQQQQHRPPAVVPRVIVELQPRELGLLLGRPGPAVARLVEECETRGYNGLVLEAWTAWASMGGFEDAAFCEAALSFIRQLGTALHESNSKQLLLAVPPVLPSHPSRPFARRELLQGLVGDGHVDGLSLMTYDHASGAPGPNAPLEWQEQNLALLLKDGDGAGGSGSKAESGNGDKQAGAGPAMRPEAVLLGLPFYGYDYTEHVQTGALDMNAVTSHTFLGELERHLPELKWDAQAAEHSVSFRQGRLRHTVWAPTHAAIAARLELAARHGVGISIWELGQGIDSFMDLL